VADGRYVLCRLIEDDEFAITPLRIYQEVKREGYFQVKVPRDIQSKVRNGSTLAYLSSLAYEVPQLFDLPVPC
jgi:hypothetical protein